MSYPNVHCVSRNDIGVAHYIFSADHHLIAHSLSNISVKNYQNRLMCVEVIACNISVVFLRHNVYCKTLNVSVPFILRILRAKHNREITGRKYQLQAKIGRNYYSISNCMVLIRQNNFAC